MKSMNKMIHDERTYIESISKQDNEAVRGALADKGADTILRICIGASEQPMPVRAMGYYASALAVQEHYFPEAELQIVHPTKIAEVTGLFAPESAHRVETRGRHSYYAAMLFFPRRMHHDSPEAGNIKGFYDNDMPSEDLQLAVADVLETVPELKARFEASGKRRGADYLAYVAAHILMHDTNPHLRQFDLKTPTQIVRPEAPRVISIGAQSERPFHLARMACRDAKIIPSDQQVQTGQLYTKHVYAPYLICNRGEPHFGPGGIPEDGSIPHSTASVERDLVYFANTRIVEREKYRPSDETKGGDNE